MEHRAIRQGDEFYCPVCRKRWGIDDKDEELKECVPAPEQEPSNRYVTPGQYAQLRRELNGDKNRKGTRRRR